MTIAELRCATANDLRELEGIWTAASKWLETTGTGQWQWPIRSTKLLSDIYNKTVWIAEIDQVTAATVTVAKQPNPLFWPEDTADALYVNRMVVDRQFKGMQLGAALLNWIGESATASGRPYVRLDAWATNAALIQYYKNHGFTEIRTVSTPGYSGTCMQRRSAYLSPSSVRIQVKQSA